MGFPVNQKLIVTPQMIGVGAPTFSGGTPTVNTPADMAQALRAADGITSRSELAQASNAQRVSAAESNIAAKPEEKQLVSNYRRLLEAFYSGKISPDMLAANKLLALHMEQALQMEQRMFTLLGNIAKMNHETLQAIIGNIRG